LMLWSVKHYQHGHYQMLGERTRFEASLGAFYGLLVRGSGVLIAAVLLAGLGGAADDTSSAPKGLALVPFFLTMILLFGVGPLLVKPYFAARLQDLVWNGTRSDHLVFVSHLRFRDLAVLSLRNWFLTLFTLGLYYPFAAVAVARLRLQAVSLDCSVDIESLVSLQATRHEDATGDAAGDFFGIDLGL
jgi:uncharacterized membrane protein YjgN (DUF898 family)